MSTITETGTVEQRAEKTVAPYGAWVSPFKIERLTDRVVFLAEPEGVDGIRWWIEGRPDEGGRQVLVRRELDGTLTRMTPEGFNARSRVHEYGGTAAFVSGDLILVSGDGSMLSRRSRPDLSIGARSGCQVVLGAAA